MFRDDPELRHTKTISNVIDTIQIFVDCISSIVDAWDNFYNTQISLFTLHARDKPSWPGLLDKIVRNVVELRRLRRLLETKRERFKFKLESVGVLCTFRIALAHKQTASYRLESRPSGRSDSARSHRQGTD